MAISRGQKAGGTLGTGLGGAATGALLGSVVPGIGTAIGAGIGGLTGLLSGYLGSPETTNNLAKKQKKAIASGKASPYGAPTGLPEGVGTYNLYTPQQQQAFNTILQQALSSLGQNQPDFAPIEAQARKGFAENTIPSIAERFSSLGAQGSSAFGQQLGAAGAGLETDLAALRSQYNMGQQQNLQNLLRIGLQPQYEAFYQPGDVAGGSFGKNLAQQLLNENTFKGLGLLANQYQQSKQPVPGVGSGAGYIPKSRDYTYNPNIGPKFQ